MGYLYWDSSSWLAYMNQAVPDQDFPDISNPRMREVNSLPFVGTAQYYLKDTWQIKVNEDLQETIQSASALYGGYIKYWYPLLYLSDDQKIHQHSMQVLIHQDSIHVSIHSFYVLIQYCTQVLIRLKKHAGTTISWAINFYRGWHFFKFQL